MRRHQRPFTCKGQPPTLDFAHDLCGDDSDSDEECTVFFDKVLHGLITTNHDLDSGDDTASDEESSDSPVPARAVIRKTSYGRPSERTYDQKLSLASRMREGKAQKRSRRIATDQAQALHDLVRSVKMAGLIWRNYLQYSVPCSRQPMYILEINACMCNVSVAFVHTSAGLSRIGFSNL